ncbi:unnamed protein product [Notodromas monacha]|uniref:Uncharacterized protein n=1 Tax=Notodromas monacha TaxID=399045 RepID=A0A7R9BUU3_9CRUS|nr:unnamed protein product [Notodromas monacha]CAG0922147.1 unnamed protein product [Notodromas monacha]
MTNPLLGPTIWGRPEIEGRILCGEYGVKLHVIEKHEVDNQSVFVHELIASNCSKSINEETVNDLYDEPNVIHIINYEGRNHFEPVLPVDGETSVLTLPYSGESKTPSQENPERIIQAAPSVDEENNQFLAKYSKQFNSNQRPKLAEDWSETIDEAKANADFKILKISTDEALGQVLKFMQILIKTVWTVLRPMIIQWQWIVKGELTERVISFKTPESQSFETLNLREIENEEDLIQELSSKGSFDLSLLLGTLKSRLQDAGQFNGDLLTIQLNTSKEFDTWRLIDYAARDNDSLSLRLLLLLGDWDLINQAEIMTNPLLGPTIWGRPEIEGRILCGEYGVKLHVIEKHEVDNQSEFVHELIESNCSKSIDKEQVYALYNEPNVIHIIINEGKSHFEPVLPSSPADGESPVPTGESRTPSQENLKPNNSASPSLEEKSTELLAKYSKKFNWDQCNSNEDQLRENLLRKDNNTKQTVWHKLASEGSIEMLKKLREWGKEKHQLDVFIGDSQEDFQNPLRVLKMKLLGWCGVGKSTLVETLKTGYIAILHWFRRSKSTGSALVWGLDHSFKKDQGKVAPASAWNQTQKLAGFPRPGMESMREKLEKNHGQGLDIFPKVFLLDCHAALSQGVKELKATLALLMLSLLRGVSGQPLVGQFTVAHLLVIKRRSVQPPARAVLGPVNPQPTKLRFGHPIVGAPEQSGWTLESKLRVEYALPATPAKDGYAGQTVRHKGAIQGIIEMLQKLQESGKIEEV